MNLIFGKGEHLISKMPRPKPSPNSKEYLYTYSEVAERLYINLQEILDDAGNLPKLAIPNNTIVFSLVLHPSFVAKSYFPKKVLKHFKLKIIGSKEVHCKPIKQVEYKNKNHIREEEPTILYFISCSLDDLETMKNNIFAIEDEKIQNDLRKIEYLEPLILKEKLKYQTRMDETKQYKEVEILLHASDKDQVIRKALKAYVKDIDKKIRLKYQKIIDGISFLNFEMKESDISKVGKFTHIRTINNTPRLRSVNVNTNTSTLNLSNYKINVKYLNENINVAILDGGFNEQNSYIQKYVDYQDLSKNFIDDELNDHGEQVSSAVLFGPIKEDETILYPFSNINNYKVCGPGMDIYEVLDKIAQVIEEDEPGFINISIGPEGEIDNNEIHLWTVTLDRLLASGKAICTIAIGNEGETKFPRINVPADSINSLSVGACNSEDFSDWEKTSYSCIGPGRTPGFVKPDGVAFGGSSKEKFNTILGNNLCSVSGTSFASPYLLRTAIGLRSLYEDSALKPIGIKTLLIHNTQRNEQTIGEVGWGRFNTKPTQIMSCPDNQVKILYQGELERSEKYKAIIPYPDGGFKGKIDIEATFCFFSDVCAEHPSNYSNYSLEATFHKTNSNNKKTTESDFFRTSNIYTDGKHITETELRKGFHKWETTVRGEVHGKQGASIIDPYFSIQHRTRESDGSSSMKKHILPFALVVTITAHEMNNLYSLIEHKYTMLEAIKPKVTLKV